MAVEATMDTVYNKVFFVTSNPYCRRECYILKKKIIAVAQNQFPFHKLSVNLHIFFVSEGLKGKK